MISIEDYNKLLENRPYKFSAEQVGFTMDGGEYKCKDCQHWYKGPIAQRSVCEIYVGKGVERMVPATASCMFWTRDGNTFPKLKEKEEGDAEDQSGT